jgi:hypothetical protein
MIATPTAVARSTKGKRHMSLQSHLAELQKRHTELEEKIDAAMASPSVDDTEIVTLKRRKLALKDEIVRLKTSPKETQH